MQGFGGYTEDEIAQQARADRAYNKAADEGGSFASPLDAFAATPANRTQVGTIGGGPGQNAIVSPIFGTRVVPRKDPAPAATPVAAPDPMAGTVWQDMPEADRPDNTVAPLLSHTIPSFLKNIGFNVDVPPPAAPTAPGAVPNPVADYGNEHRRPTYGQRTVSPALVPPPAAVPSQPTAAAPTIAGTASMGGVTKSYTQDQLNEMAAGGTPQSRFKGPGEIYANEMAINVAHDSYRRGELSPKDYIAFLGQQAGQAAQLSDPAVIAKNKGAALDLQAKQSIDTVYQQLLKTTDKKEQHRLLNILATLQGKTPNDRMIKLAGRKTKDTLGNETQEAETAIDPYGDIRISGAGGEIGALAGGKGGKPQVIDANQFQQAMKETGMKADALRAFLLQHGVTVG